MQVGYMDEIWHRWEWPQYEIGDKDETNTCKHYRKSTHMDVNYRLDGIQHGRNWELKNMNTWMKVSVWMKLTTWMDVIIMHMVEFDPYD